MPHKRRMRYNRRWTDEQKIAIVKECMAARAKDLEYGAVGGISAVLAKYNLKTSFLTIWKHDLKKRGLI